MDAIENPKNQDKKIIDSAVTFPLYILDKKPFFSFILFYFILFSLTCFHLF